MFSAGLAPLNMVQALITEASNIHAKIFVHHRALFK